ncbi:MAG: class I SAM-dependent methyltransferase [Armatimonadota bacterium]|nr:MAG: class I SAM-dependent methyltransferase [Armatimonadota bacterium]
MNPDSNLYRDAWISETYDYHYATRGIGDDVALWLALAAQTGGPVLELACGTGRVVLPLARAGYEITGLDLSPHQLAVARRKLAQEPGEVQARVRLVEGDMSGFDLGATYGLIIIPFRSFQALLERSQQRGCLESCARHLSPGGRLAIDVFNPRMSRLAAIGPVEESEATYTGPDGSDIRETGKTEYDTANQRLVWRPRYECTAPNGEVMVREYALELRYFFRFEMEWMLDAGGFEVEALYGDFDRSALTAESPEMIFVARRAR